MFFELVFVLVLFSFFSANLVIIIVLYLIVLVCIFNFSLVGCFILIQKVGYMYLKTKIEGEKSFIVDGFIIFGLISRISSHLQMAFVPSITTSQEHSVDHISVHDVCVTGTLLMAIFPQNVCNKCALGWVGGTVVCQEPV